MAKKDKLKLGELNLDDELDFGEIDIGDIDQQSNNKKDDRSPVTKTFKGTIEGASSALKDKAMFGRVLRASLPKEYGEVLDRTGDISGEVTGLYNDAVKEIKPSLVRMSRSVDRLVPANMKRTKDFVSKIKKMLGADEVAASSRSLEQEQEGEIQGKLAEIFVAQAEQTAKQFAEERAEEQIKEKIETKRFQGQFGLLNSINMNMTRLANYNDRVNSAYQKKSLELQYRSYFVQKDMLQTTKRFYEIFKVQHDTIVKNTGLPDYVKMRMSEHLKDAAKRKFSNSIHSALFGNGEFLKRGVQNLKQAAKEKIQHYRDVFEKAASGLESAADSRQQLADMEELEKSMGGQSNGMYGVAGNVIGSMGVEKLLTMFGKKFAAAKMGTGSKGSNFLIDLLTKTYDLESFTKNARKKYFQDDGKDHAVLSKDWALNKGKSAIGSLIDIFTGGGKNTTIGGLHGLSDAGEAAIFDGRTQKSITTIIPGFLARILREIQILRTGNENTEMTEFDLDSGKFTSKSNLKKSITNMLTKAVNDGGLGYKINNVYDALTQGENLSPNAQRAIRARLHGAAFEGGPNDFRYFMHDNFTKGLSKKVAGEIKSVFGKRFGRRQAEGRGRNLELARRMTDMRSSIGNMEERIETLIKSGYEETLAEMGVIKENPAGGYIINKEKYRELSKAGFLNDPDSAKIIDSDINVKQGIRGFSGKNALRAIKNTKVFQWLYKKGKGDGGAHIGPMAQDVKRNMGEDAAPGGVKLDLATMNGLNMAAIGELHDEIKGRGGKIRGNPKSSIYWLKHINLHTRLIVERLDNLGRIGFGVPNLDTTALKNFLGKQFDIAKDAVSAGFDKAKNKASETFELSKEKAAELYALLQEKANGAKGRLSDKISQYADGKMDSFGGIVKNLAVASGALIAKTFETVSDKVIAGGKSLNKNVLQPGKDKAVELYKKHKDPTIELAKSLYGKGAHLVGVAFDKARNALSDLVSNKLPAGYNFVAKVLGKGKELLKDLVDGPADVYVKGRPTPALQAILMRGGMYKDQMTGKPVMRPSDIKGPVVNLKNEVVLSIDDIKQGLLDVNGKPIESFGKKLSDIALGFGARVYGRMSNAFKAMKEAGAGIGNRLKGFAKGLKDRAGGGMGGGQVITLLTQIRDLLNKRLPGDQEDFSPPKASSGEESGSGESFVGPPSPSFAQSVSSTGRSLWSKAKDVANDLKTGGELRNKIDTQVNRARSSKLGQKVSGLVDKAKSTWAGKKSESLKDAFGKTRLGGFMKATGAKGRSLLSGASDFLFKKKEDEGEQSDTTGNQGGLLGALAGMISNAVGRTKQAITSHKDIRAKKGEREGNWKQMLEKQEAREKERKANTIIAQADPTVRYKSGKNVIDTIIEKAQGGYDYLKDKFSSGLDTAADVADIAGDIGGNSSDGRKPKKKPGRIRRAVNAVGRGAVRAGRLAKNTMLPSAGTAARRAATATGQVGRATIGAGKAAVKSGSLIGRAATATGRGVIATGNGLATVGNAVKNTAGVATRAVGLGGVASKIGTGLTIARNVGMVAGLASGGILPMAIAGGSALATLFASPVVLGAAAIGLGAYGLYKGAKFLTRNKASKLTRVRMVQYGLSDELSNKYHQIFELENYLEKECRGFNGGQAYLLERTIDPDKVLDIFGVDKEDAQRMEDFTTWFQNRFKPVFLSHLTALYGVDTKRSLSDIDDLEPEPKDKYIQAASNVPSAYSTTESPFEDVEKLTTGSKDVSAALEVARAEYKDKLGKKDKKEQGFLSKSFEYATKNRTLDRMAAAGGFKGFMAKTAKFVPGFALMMNLKDSFGKLLVSAGQKLGVIPPSRTDALSAIRYKSYGLNAIDENKVSTLIYLEELLEKKIVIKGGTANFAGDANEILSKIGQEFGISSAGDSHIQTWLDWFQKRFLPVYLNFVGTGFQLTGKRLPKEIEITLTPKQKYDLASRITGTSGIWDFTSSPWKDDEELAASSDVCKENLQFLKDAVKTQEANEEKSANRIAPVAKLSVVAPEKPPVPDKLNPQANQPTSGQVPGGQPNTTEPINAGGEGEGQKVGESTKVEPGQQESGTMIGSKVPLQTGPLADPLQGDQFIQLKPGVSLANLQPEVLKNLKMMAAEYGQQTGKSISINSGSRTSQEQLALYKADPSKAAKPGTSLHEFGLALDVNRGTLNELESMGLMRKYGFTRPVGGEPWHMEPAGIQVDLQGAKKDPNLAESLVAASPGRGGGGVGTIPGSPKGRRNSQLAISLLEGGASKTVTTPTADKDKVSTALAQQGSGKSSNVVSMADWKPKKLEGTQIASAKPSGLGSMGGIGAANQANKSYGKGNDLSEAEPSTLDRQQQPGAGKVKGGEKSPLPPTVKVAPVPSQQPQSSGTGFSAIRPALPGTVNPVASRAKEQGNNFALGGAEKVITNIDSTLTESLQVQTQMLDVMKELLKAVGPENLQAMAAALAGGGTGQTVPTSTSGKQPGAMPKSAVSLRRSA